MGEIFRARLPPVHAGGAYDECTRAEMRHKELALHLRRAVRAHRVGLSVFVIRARLPVKNKIRREKHKVTPAAAAFFGERPRAVDVGAQTLILLLFAGIDVRERRGKKNGIGPDTVEELANSAAVADVELAEPGNRMPQVRSGYLLRLKGTDQVTPHEARGACNNGPHRCFKPQS